METEVMDADYVYKLWILWKSYALTTDSIYYITLNIKWLDIGLKKKKKKKKINNVWNWLPG
jgi:hypothetical protein